MGKRFSVIIPNYNGADTIGKCLEAVFSSRHRSFEVIVVDDCSKDGSVAVISRFPCRLIRLDRRSGASRARNIGAQNSTGEVLFFTDSDCLLRPDALPIADEAIADRQDSVLGGTYTKMPYDDDFFSQFQSVFINYSETKKKNPDYIASHAMMIDRNLFIRSGGFPENFLPIIEDVEFSHRLRRSGTKLEMHPGIMVQHIFRFSPLRSLANAFRKAKFWTAYSLGNRDILNDSGTASSELKVNVLSCFLSVAIAILYLILRKNSIFIPLAGVFGLNFFFNRKLLSAFYEAGGPLFFIMSAIYYMLVYPFAVGAGSSAGLLQYMVRPSLREKTSAHGVAENKEGREPDAGPAETGRPL